MPEAGSVFLWPNAWVAAQPRYFAERQSRVWNVSEADGVPLVTMYGIVCESPAETRECATFLEKFAGLEFNEH